MQAFIRTTKDSWKKETAAHLIVSFDKTTTKTSSELMPEAGRNLSRCACHYFRSLPDSFQSPTWTFCWLLQQILSVRIPHFRRGKRKLLINEEVTWMYGRRGRRQGSGSREKKCPAGGVTEAVHTRERILVLTAGGRMRKWNLTKTS